MSEVTSVEAAKVPPSGDGEGKRIIIAGGGTGGHIFPAIAIANAILKQQPQTEILLDRKSVV